MLIPLVLWMPLLMAAHEPGDIIARCAGVSIHYGEVAVEPHLLGRLPRGPKAAGLSESDLRRAVEQERLDRRIISLALEFADKHYGLHVTAAEVEAALPLNARNEAAFRREFESSLVVPKAARRVLHGESKDKVFEEMLRGLPGMTPQFFEQALQVFSSDRVIDDFLSKDQAALTRSRIVEETRLAVLLKKLRALAAQRSKATHQPVDDTRAALWLDLLQSSRATILDPEFQLPSWKGVL